VKLEVTHRRILMCRINLLFRYTKEYPRTPPTVEILEQERLPEEEIQKLEDIINREIGAHLRRKETLVFDLCQALMDHLNAYAEPLKKFIIKVDMNSATMWDEREAKNKYKGSFCLFSLELTILVLQEKQLKQTEIEMKKSKP